MKEANPIVEDICDLRFELQCQFFDDTVEECRVEMLALVGARARFSGNDSACEAALFDLLDCHVENPCDDVLDQIYESSEPEHPCPSLEEASVASCGDFF